VLDIDNGPYGSDIYVISIFFDSKFILQWIDHELQLSDQQKEDLRSEITGILSVVVNLVGRLIVASPSPRMLKHSWNGHGQVT